MKPTPKKPIAAERPKQEMPADVIGSLMSAVRNSFYGDQPEKWFADQHFIKRRVVTWPAVWLNKRGVTLSPERYKEIIMGIFMGIKQHGNTASVKHWPAYLTYAVQQHFKIHGEEYYNEGKAIRNTTEAVLLACKLAVGEKKASDVIAGMAEVNRALTSASNKRKKKSDAAKQQLSLF